MIPVINCTLDAFAVFILWAIYLNYPWWRLVGIKNKAFRNFRSFTLLDCLSENSTDLSADYFIEKACPILSPDIKAIPPTDFDYFSYYFTLE